MIYNKNDRRGFEYDRLDSNSTGHLQKRTIIYTREDVMIIFGKKIINKQNIRLKFKFNSTEFFFKEMLYKI